MRCYAFSRDKERNQKDIEDVERVRGQTKRMKMGRKERKEAKQRQIEERRMAIVNGREKTIADEFCFGGLGDEGKLGTGELLYPEAERSPFRCV